ncbi:sensor histidine kinase [Aquimarina sediminis]|uniref:sensor histidine kinase n=1 Tax=Aquimarina sediminis TaxID=2070536 RepID=UPI000CA05A94|nr:sensor histidine kinase [Aquimarina sediminis]
MIKHFYLFIVLIITLPILAFSNIGSVHQVLNELKFNNFETATKITKNSPLNESLKGVLTAYIQVRKYGCEEQLKNIVPLKNDTYFFIIDNLKNGLHLYYNDGDEINAFKKLNLALEKAIKIEEPFLISESLRAILEIYNNQSAGNDEKSHISLLNIYKNNLTDRYEKAHYHYYYFRLKQRYNKNIELLDPKIIQNAKETITDLRFKPLLGKLYISNATYYFYYLKKKDSAITYLNEAKLVFKNSKHFLDQERFLAASINLAGYYTKTNRANEALSQLDNINFINNSGYIFSLLKKYYWKKKWEAFESLKVYDSSYFYKSKYFEHEFNLKQSASLFKISELRTLEKEKKIVQLLNTNLKTEASRIRNRNLLIGSLSLIIIGSILGILLYKNTKRKQRIAEQNREIEIQKTEKLLKEQELTAIDAMISGQEKERQRLANDLHDNLGSTLATVKLHFQHLRSNKDNPKIKNIDELYSKTDNLLEEAYQKVRTIAHEKNSGVMANQGLLPAIKNLAKKVSNGKHLQIEVQDYGLEERLDNALEISIFRMIQELITNAIKHANATEIHISLTNHDSLLNIIVEDNGKGFDAKILPQKDGMGLATIEKRIEHLEGTFEIDSTIDKGTNIIINIPI